MKHCLITLSLCLFLCPFSELRAEIEVLNRLQDDRVNLQAQRDAIENSEKVKLKVGNQLSSWFIFGFR